jgi:predicted transcriptional regulator
MQKKNNHNNTNNNDIILSLQKDITDLIQLKLKLAQQISGNVNQAEYQHFFKHQEPAVSIENSVFDDYIICLEDGKKVTLLKTHLERKYNMSFEFYRQKWGLPANYPCIAKSYTEMRKNIAKKGQLGKGLNINRGRKKKNS